ncbi:PTS sugar transporter subunit IIA [Corticicoccus populi]|uniref:PTS sugar transporter subunit IIA n=1 Tax=Corticicoccus populi TaxID=1812821 RepID=A0ABW5WSZ3_9STAP
MKDKVLFKLFTGCDIKDEAELYDFVSERVFPNHPESRNRLVQQFEQRERLGSALISEHAVLPHAESDFIKESKVLVLQIKNSIPVWGGTPVAIRLAVVILLKEDEQFDVKKRISSFTRMLADEDLLEQLFEAEEDEFYQIIKMEE